MHGKFFPKLQFCIICLSTGCGTLQEVCVEELKHVMDLLHCTRCILHLV